MRPIALIPARGGSKRIPRKNIADLGGQPIIAYAIKTCLDSGLFAQVIVSTEDTEIAAIAEAQGAEVDARPPHLAKDSVPAKLVCQELLQRRFNDKSMPELFCLVYPIAAFLEPRDLIESAARMEDCDGVLGVSEYQVHPYKALIEQDAYLQALWPEKNAQQSQQYPRTYASNGTFCWVRTSIFLQTPSFYPPRLRGHVIPQDRAVDIDTPEDLAQARILMRLKAEERALTPGRRKEGDGRPVFAFRVDASLKIGTGHVMRCLTLARGLRNRGAQCHFICRALDGHLGAMIAAQGFKLHLLPAPSIPPSSAGSESDWAEVPAHQDAKQTREVLDVLAPNWVVVDHYGFATDWQEQALPQGCRLMVIDDLANRPHRADILLDVNLGREKQDYEDLVPATCKTLTGPAYALLRPDYADNRARVLVDRATRRLRNILISMGGVDLPDATSQVLETLAGVTLPEDCRVTVVMGAVAPSLAKVRTLAAKMPFPCKVLVSVDNVHSLMAAADLAIGAVGGTTWERCALGLPTLMLTIAANQLPGARAVDKAGAAVLLGDVGDADWPKKLAREILAISDAGRLQHMAETCAAICDGDGTSRVIATILDGPMEYRQAEISDARRVWEWRRAGEAERYYKSQGNTPYAKHLNWFAMALAAPEITFAILQRADLPIGYVRLDRQESASAQDPASAYVSICFAAGERGQGLGQDALQIAHGIAMDAGIERLLAEIHPDNAASIALFKKVGYTERPDLDGFKTYIYSL